MKVILSLPTSTPRTPRHTPEASSAWCPKEPWERNHHLVKTTVITCKQESLTDIKIDGEKYDEKQDIYIVIKHLPTGRLLIMKEKRNFTVEKPQRDTA